VEIDCEALQIPENIEVNVNDLQIGDSITASDLVLPPGAKLLSDPDALVVQCVEPRAEEEEEEAIEGAAAGAEPEVIGRKAEEEGEASEN